MERRLSARLPGGRFPAAAPAGRIAHRI